MTQQALLMDVAAKVLADNLASLPCAAAAEQHYLCARSRRCNRSYAAQFLPGVLPRVLLFFGDVLATISDVITMLGIVTLRFIPGRSRPRPEHHVKPLRTTGDTKSSVDCLIPIFDTMLKKLPPHQQLTRAISA